MSKPYRLYNFNVMAERQLSKAVTAYIGQDIRVPTPSGRHNDRLFAI